MANYNKVILAGNLTRDPQLSYLPNQTPAVEIGMAINRKWRGQDGNQREDTCFVDCRAYGKQAEIINQYMKKGRPLLIDGRLQFASWEGKDGQKRSKLRVIIENFQFLGGRSDGASQGQGQGYGGAPARQGGYSPPAQAAPAAGQEQPAPTPEDFGDQGPDDIPF